MITQLRVRRCLKQRIALQSSRPIDFDQHQAQYLEALDLYHDSGKSPRTSLERWRFDTKMHRVLAMAIQHSSYNDVISQQYLCATISRAYGMNPYGKSDVVKRLITCLETIGPDIDAANALLGVMASTRIGLRYKFTLSNQDHLEELEKVTRALVLWRDDDTLSAMTALAESFTAAEIAYNYTSPPRSPHLGEIPDALVRLHHTAVRLMESRV